MALTVGLGFMPILLMPDRSGIMPALALLPNWMGAGLFTASVLGFFGIVRMMRNGVEEPAQAIRAYFVHNGSRLCLFALAMLLAGINMTAFMWMKPLLNYMFPFWADPALAAADRTLFGADPWMYLTWLNSDLFAMIYHRGWFAALIVTLVVILFRAPSNEKSALMITYFLLWSVLGPVVHVILPAAGPVFYERLGYGAEFAGLTAAGETSQVIAYLWNTYQQNSFDIASGISAMPSLHIATAAWMVLAATRPWRAPMIAFALLTFALSVALGWHYAIDGIVGAAGAFLIWLMITSRYNVRHVPRPLPQ